MLLLLPCIKLLNGSSSDQLISKKAIKFGGQLHLVEAAILTSSDVIHSMGYTSLQLSFTYVNNV